jgi:hypothetical protein
MAGVIVPACIILPMLSTPWFMAQGFRSKQAGWWYRPARISAVPKIR